MKRPSDEITRLAEQCKPDRSFPPGMSKMDAVSILRYIGWLEKWFDTDRWIKENVKFSSDPESPSTVPDTAQADASGEA